jgi:hypothetical protein
VGFILPDAAASEEPGVPELLPHLANSPPLLKPGWLTRFRGVSSKFALNFPSLHNTATTSLKYNLPLSDGNFPLNK